jgi:molecular chaperone GrpE
VSEAKQFDENEAVENDVIDEADKASENSEVLEDLEFEGIGGDNSTETIQSQLDEMKSEKLRFEEEVKKLNNELETYKERLARTTAEYENFRRRTAKEKEGIYTDACEDVLKNIFPVLDNLERAYSVNGSVEDIKKGIEMTIRQFNDAFSKLQVEEIATDVEFDPNLHNAVMHVEDEKVGKNAIVEVFQKGYKKGNKVLRYSMVKVAN